MNGDKILRLSLFVGALCILMCAFFIPGAKAGPYISGHAGKTFVGDADASLLGANFGEIDFSKAYNFGGALGWDFDNFRVEGELSYRRANFDTIDMTLPIIGPMTTDIDGHIRALSTMFNAWYDFEVGPFVPYLGGGIGAAHAHAEINSINAVPFVQESDGWVFAYQAGGGLGFEILPATVISLGYRYFAMKRPELGGGIKGEFRTHNIEAGLRVGF